jgi:hypothetical protein
MDALRLNRLEIDGVGERLHELYRWRLAQRETALCAADDSSLQVA